jgi:hypothetical protein
MIGRITWNLYMAICGMVLTFMFAIPHNLLGTAFLRSLYVFVFLFILGFVIRFLLGTVVGLKDIVLEQPLYVNEQEEGKGEHVNLITPQEGGVPLQTSFSSQTDDEFKPITARSLKGSPDEDPEKVVKAIRDMVDE